MTNNEKYKRELDSVKASDAFKQSTIALLQQVQQEAGDEQARTRLKQKFFTQGRIVALAATLVLLVGGFVTLRGAFMPAGEAAPMAEQATGAASIAAAESTPSVDANDYVEDAESARVLDTENDVAETYAATEDREGTAYTPAEDGAGKEAAQEAWNVQTTPNAPAPLMPPAPRPSRLPYLIVGFVCLLAALVIGVVLIYKKVSSKKK